MTKATKATVAKAQTTKAATPKPAAKKGIKPPSQAAKTIPKEYSYDAHRAAVCEEIYQNRIFDVHPENIKLLEKAGLGYEEGLLVILEMQPDIDIKKVAIHLAACMDRLWEALSINAQILDDKTKTLHMVDKRLPEIVEWATLEMVSRLDAKEKVKVSIKNTENAIASAEVRRRVNKEAAPHIYNYWKSERKQFSSDKEFSAHAKNKYQEEHTTSPKLSAIEAMCRAWKAGKSIHGIPIAM